MKVKMLTRVLIASAVVGVVSGVAELIGGEPYSLGIVIAACVWPLTVIVRELTPMRRKRDGNV